MKRFFSLVALSGFVALTTTCAPGKGLNLFPLSDDVRLGKQVSEQIESNTAEYPILDQASNQEVYDFIFKLRDDILNSGKVRYKDEFVWQIKIIDNDEVLNAFCTPGGYIYVYTGLIKYLDSQDQLAGVMGHEIAHADLRHSTRQMTKAFGMQLVSDALLGDQEALSQIATGLLSLKFSRAHETESDNKSVEYLCHTPYNASGAAGFFEKITAEGGGRTPEFLSTHPNPHNRVENIKAQQTTMGCTGTETYDAEYARIKALLD